VISIFFLSFFFSSPNLSGRKLDVYHTSARVKQRSHCVQRCAAVRSGALRGSAQRRATPRSAAQRRAVLRSVARRCAACDARHCAALPAIYLCKSYANEVSN